MTSATTPAQPRETSSARLVATLGAAGLLSGLILVGAYEVTLPRIEANEARALRAAVFEVVPGSTVLVAYVPDETGALAPAADEDAARASVYAARDEAGALVGWAIAAKGPGFQDDITLIYGFDPLERRLVGMRVLDSRETPGLGDKIYKDDSFVSGFEALAVDPEIVLVKKGERSSENEVDAITGATISSRAVVRIINGANAEWLDRLPARAAETGGTP